MTAEELFALGLNRDTVMAILSMRNEEEAEEERLRSGKEAEIARLREEIGLKDAAVTEAVEAEKTAAADREAMLCRAHGEALEKAKAEQLAAFRREKIGAAAEKAGFATEFARRAAERAMDEDESCDPEAYLAALREREPGLFMPDRGGLPCFTTGEGEEEEARITAPPPFVYLRKPVSV